MRCNICSFENTDSARFCQNCGQPLARPCPNCNTINVPAAKFCINCGYNLQPAQTDAPVIGKTSESTAGSSPAQVDPRLSRLTAATPASLKAKIKEASNLLGERRVVTAVFADVVGSVALAEQMDPEDWAAIMNHAFDLLVPAVYRYEGTITRLMGDALLAFFGAPVAHEDDPVRAVRAGLDLIATAHQYAEEVRQEFGIDFAMRVGMNTGPVVVGDVGNDLVYEYTAMGDAVNLAARLQSAAPPMSVLISENTYRFIAPVFDCDDMGSIHVKGKSEPVHVYRVVGQKLRPDPVRGISGLESQLVGRDIELQVLVNLSEIVLSGVGRIALIIADAGLGKTRLVSEWKANLFYKYTKQDVRWIEGRCLSYGQSLAYHLLIDLLNSILNSFEPANESDLPNTLKVTTERLFGEAAITIYPYIGHLLSFKMDEHANERIRSLDPQTLQAQYFASIRQFLTKISEEQPLIIVLEDTHWADPSSVDLLSRLVTLVSEVPIFFVFLMRPERDVPGWKLVNAIKDRFGEGLTEINLSPLSETHSELLLTNLLDIQTLPENLRNLILNKAEGNPFFLEEVIRMLIDREILTYQGDEWSVQKQIDHVDIPDNLQGLLLARIDRLPEEVKRTLRVAAVIGRQFSVRILEQVLEKQSQG